MGYQGSSGGSAVNREALPRSFQPGDRPFLYQENTNAAICVVDLEPSPHLVASTKAQMTAQSNPSAGFCRHEISITEEVHPLQASIHGETASVRRIPTNGRTCHWESRENGSG